ncbi:MAG TPA: hypothetical protein V6D08_01645 [Candidatus Obscuribacterales bacterium]
MNISLDSGGELLEPAVDLGCELKQTVYDCLYLCLAVELSSRQVTAYQRSYQSIRDTPLSDSIEWVGRLVLP